MKKLSGPECEKLRDALLSAFPQKSSLEEMLWYKLDKKLNELFGEGRLSYIIFQLIEKAEAEGWTEKLVKAAQSQNPGNLQLKAVAKELFPNQNFSINDTAKLPQQPIEETLELETKPHVPVLPIFKFDVATIEVISSPSLWKKPINIIKHSRQAQYFTEKLPTNITLEMVFIPGGEFIMGSPETEKGSSDSERPQHLVTVQPLFMGKYPVTQAQWRAVATLPQVNRKLNPDPSRFKGDNLPVERISWYEAVEFCDRISKYTGKKYRLPSEAEWEYACRGGTTTPFHFGETITPKLANYDGEYTYGSGTKGENRGKTTPVGSFEVANAFGLSDMHGNVWEWCADDWHDNYNNAPTDGSAWLNTSQNDNDNHFQMLRGGSWYGDPDFCRSASRNGNLNGSFNYNVGFRVVFASVART